MPEPEESSPRSDPADSTPTRRNLDEEFFHPPDPAVNAERVLAYQQVQQQIISPVGGWLQKVDPKAYLLVKNPAEGDLSRLRAESDIDVVITSVSADDPRQYIQLLQELQHRAEEVIDATRTSEGNRQIVPLFFTTERVEFDLIERCQSEFKDAIIVPIHLLIHRNHAEFLVRDAVAYEGLVDQITPLIQPDYPTKPSGYLTAQEAAVKVDFAGADPEDMREQLIEVPKPISELSSWRKVVRDLYLSSQSNELLSSTERALAHYTLNAHLYSAESRARKLVDTIWRAVRKQSTSKQMEIDDYLSEISTSSADDLCEAFAQIDSARRNGTVVTQLDPEILTSPVEMLMRALSPNRVVTPQTESSSLLVSPSSLGSESGDTPMEEKSVFDRRRSAEQLGLLAKGTEAERNDALVLLESALEDPDPAVRAWATYSVAEFGVVASGLAEHLLRNTRDHCPEVRWWSIYALGEVGYDLQVVADALLEILRLDEPISKSYRAALNAQANHILDERHLLWEEGDDEGVNRADYSVDFTERPRWPEKHAAVHALGKVGQKALKPFVERFGDIGNLDSCKDPVGFAVPLTTFELASDATRELLAPHLDQLSRPDLFVRPSREQFRSDLRSYSWKSYLEALQTGGENSLLNLGMLRIGTGHPGEEAVAAILRSGGPEVLPDLELMLQIEERPFFICSLLQALEEIYEHHDGNSSLVEPLLSHQDTVVRQFAATTLGRIGDANLEACNELWLLAQNASIQPERKAVRSALMILSPEHREELRDLMRQEIDKGLNVEDNVWQLSNLARYGIDVLAELRSALAWDEEQKKSRENRSTIKRCVELTLFTLYNSDEGLSPELLKLATDYGLDLYPSIDPDEDPDEDPSNEPF